MPFSFKVQMFQKVQPILRPDIMGVKGEKRFQIKGRYT
jgi:hypothetical protein